MNLRAWSAWASVSHFPEIVLLVSEKDAVLRKMLLPGFHSFDVKACAVCFRSFEYCCVKSVLVELVNFSEELPCPVDCFYLEVVSETPVSEHLEHGMVICVASYLLEVVVLAAHAKAFLAVSHSFPSCRTIAEEPVLELVHTCVGEHKRRVVFYNHGCRWHNLMPL